MVWLMIGVKS